MRRPSASAVASLLVLNIQRYAEEKGKKVSRVRLSRITMSKIAKRRTFRDAFKDDLHEALNDLGWFWLELPGGSFALLEIEPIESWTKISASRVIATRNALLEETIDEDDLEGLVNVGAQTDDEDGDD